MTPMIQSLKDNGVEQIDLLLGSRTREVFEHNPHVKRIYVWDKSKPFSLKLFFEIFKNRYQAMFDFTPTGQYAWISLLFFWIPMRVGFNFKNRGFWLTHKVALPNGYSEKPMSEYYLDLIKCLNLNPTSNRMQFCTTPNDVDSCESLLKGLKINRQMQILAVSPGGGESWGSDARLKRWPVSHFAELLKKIREENCNHVILILGSKNEYELGRDLERYFSPDVIFNLCGQTSLQVTAAILKKSSLFIANDSGLVHLAHAIGVPLVSIYGPVDPLVYGPYPPTSKSISVYHQGPACRPCYQRFRYRQECVGVECLTQLSAEEVFAKISFLTCERVS